MLFGSTANREFDGNERYKALRQLGEGAFGKVYLCLDTRYNEEVAIKCLARTRYLSKYMEREILIHRQLAHPHVVEFIEVFLTDNHLCIVMEYCAGGDLFNYVKRMRGVQEPMARWLFQQFILGLEYCHKLNVVSRDIKMENCLLDGSSPPVLKIADFGYAKDELNHSQSKSKVGSMGYAAPEVIRTIKDVYDGKTADIWSAGVLLYSMLFGTYPFDRRGDEKLDPGKKMQLVLHRLLHCDYIIPKGISAECRDLLTKILVNDPNKRLTIPEIYKHPWFKKDLPEGIESFNDEMIVQKPNCIQSIEDIEAILAQAGSPRFSKLSKTPHLRGLRDCEVEYDELAEQFSGSLSQMNSMLSSLVDYDIGEELEQLELAASVYA